MYVTAPISTRVQFGELLNGMGLIGLAAEIGTHRGDFARSLIDKWKGERLYCIDPWANPPDYVDQARFLEGGGEFRERDKFDCERRLYSHRKRVEMLQMTSEEALKRFQDDSLDFVYLDGNHEAPHALFDIEHWWAKVKPGGMLAGHDIICPGPVDVPDNWGRYIQPALQAFFGDDVYIYLIPDELQTNWSYYVIKAT